MSVPLPHLYPESAKTLVKSLKKSLAKKGVTVTLGVMQEALANAFGAKNWDTLCAPKGVKGLSLPPLPKDLNEMDDLLALDINGPDSDSIVTAIYNEGIGDDVFVPRDSSHVRVYREFSLFMEFVLDRTPDARFGGYFKFRDGDSRLFGASEKIAKFDYLPHKEVDNLWHQIDEFIDLIEAVPWLAHGYIIFGDYLLASCLPMEAFRWFEASSSMYLEILNSYYGGPDEIDVTIPENNWFLRSEWGRYRCLLEMNRKMESGQVLNRLLEWDPDMSVLRQYNG